jgi:hypothetical protein
VISAFENQYRKNKLLFLREKNRRLHFGSPAVEGTGTSLPEASGAPPAVIATPQPGGTGVAGLGRGATGSWVRKKIHGLKDPFWTDNYGILYLSRNFVKLNC